MDIQRFFLIILLLHGLNTSLLAQPNAPREQSVMLNGSNHFIKSIGFGEPLVIVHGGPGLAHNYLYDPFLPLSADRTLIFYDQRGCGKSDALNPVDSVTISTLVEDLEHLRRYFRIDRLDLVGQSWGAVIALNYIHRYPEYVKKLLLLEPAPGSKDYLPAVQAAISARLTSSARERLAKLGQMPDLRTSPAIFKEFLGIRTSTYFCDTTVAVHPRFEYFDSSAVAKFFASAAQFGPYLMSYDLYPLMTTINVPTLIIHGDYDVIPSEAIERMGKAIRNSETHIVKNCGHFVHLEQPAVYISLVRQFLKK